MAVIMVWINTAIFKLCKRLSCSAETILKCTTVTGYLENTNEITGAKSPFDFVAGAPKQEGTLAKWCLSLGDFH